MLEVFFYSIGYNLASILLYSFIYFLYCIVFIIIVTAFVCNINKNKAIWVSFIGFLLITLFIKWYTVNFTTVVFKLNIIIYCIVLAPVLYIAFRYLTCMWRVFVVFNVGLFPIVFNIFYHVKKSANITKLKLCIVYDCRGLSYTEYFFVVIGYCFAIMLFIICCWLIALFGVRYIEKLKVKGSKLNKFIIYKLIKLFVLCYVFVLSTMFCGLILVNAVALNLFIFYNNKILVLFIAVLIIGLLVLIICRQLFLLYKRYKPWLQQK